LRLATLENAHSALARKLKGRHLQMIAIGGSIGELQPPHPQGSGLHGGRLTLYLTQALVCSWPLVKPWLLAGPRPCYWPSPSSAPCFTARARPWVNWQSYSPSLAPSPRGLPAF
jgi:hypothetical protein